MKLTVNGAAVFAATGGKEFDTKLPALVFVHGAGCDHTVWQQQARYFAHHGFAVLALDLPGHGSSDGPALTSVQAIAEWLAETVWTAGARRVVLIGHSLGALACLEMASRYPDRVDGLALIGVAGRMPVHPDLLAAATANREAAVDFIASWGHGALAHRGGNIAPGIWLIQAGARLLEQAGDGVLAADLGAADSYKDAVEAAGRVACPVLYLLGAQDRMTPVKAAAPLIAATGQATKTVLPESGHMLSVEAPDATRAALRGFLGQSA